MGAKQVWLKDGQLQTYTNKWEPVGPAPEPVAVTGVSLDESSLTLGIDETQKLTATITPSNATDKKVSWSSSDDATATVSSDGTVRGVAGGSATITVTTHDGNFTATCEVTVSSGQHEVESVALNNLSTQYPNQGYQGMGGGTGIQVNPYTASNLNVVVSSSDPSIVEVGEISYDAEPTQWAIGYVPFYYTGVGTATITVTSVENPNATQSYTIEVLPKTDVQSISNVSKLSFIAFAGQPVYQALTFDYLPVDASSVGMDVLFRLKSGETDIGYGNVQQNEPGVGALNFFGDQNAQPGDSAVYELYVNGSDALPVEITVTIGTSVESVTFADESKMTIIEGNSDSRSFTYLPVDADVEDFIWADGGQYTNAEVTKDSDGNAHVTLTGLSEGQGILQLKNRAGWQTLAGFPYEVVESIPVESISNISVNNMWVGEGGTKTFTFDYLPANANDFSGISFVDSTYTSTSATYNSGTATVTVEGLNYTTTTSASVGIQLGGASAGSVDVDVRAYANVVVDPSGAGSVSPSVIHVPYGGVIGSSDYNVNPCTVNIYTSASSGTLLDTVTITATAESGYTFGIFLEAIGSEGYDPSVSRDGSICYFNQNQ